MKNAIKTVKKILVTTDFSDLSLEALYRAKIFASLFKAEIHLIHVIDHVPILAFQSIDLQMDTLLEAITKRTTTRLDVFARTHLKGFRRMVRVVRRGNPADEVIKYADEARIDLIIISTHGRTGLAHIVLGSVAEKVVRHSSVPVLTIKPQPMRAKVHKKSHIRRERS